VKGAVDEESDPQGLTPTAGTRLCHSPPGSGDSCNLFDSLDDVADHARDQLLIIPFSHHPDQRLAAGRTDDDAAGAAKLGLAGVDRRAHATVLERLAVPIAHVLQDLRQRLDWLAALSSKSFLGPDE
jgi:hypothetical protein